MALNGVEAMDGRGRLSLEVERQNGDVVIAVSDTGRGISAGGAGRASSSRSTPEAETAPAWD